MPHFILAFVVGLALSLKAYLLAVSSGGLLATLMIFNAGIRMVRALSLLIMMAFGFQWAEWSTAWQVPKALAHDSMKLDVIGQIQGLIDDDGKRAKFVLESIDSSGHRFKLHW